MTICRIPYGKPDRSYRILTKEAILNELKRRGIEPVNIADNYIEIEISNFIEEEIKSDRYN